MVSASVKHLAALDWSAASDPQRCFAAQLELEGLAVVDANRLVKVAATHFDIERQPTDTPPLVLANRSAEQVQVYYARSTPPELLQACQRVSWATIFDDPSELLALLKQKTSCTAAERSITYTFPYIADIKLEGTQAFVGSDDTLLQQCNPSLYRRFPMAYGVLHDHRVVSCCVSARENERAGEAWVYTLPAYRQQGFGSRAVLFWASQLQAAGKLPLYSHEPTNTASRTLAQKLGLIQVFENCSFS